MGNSINWHKIAVEADPQLTASEREAWRESEERYRQLVDGLPEFISHCLPDGTLTFVNTAYAGHHGMTRDEMIGSNIFEFVPADEQDRVRRYFAGLRPDKSYDRIENMVVMPDGSRRWQEWTDRAYFNDLGEPTAFQSFGRDITERKRIEAALLESAATLKDVQRISHVGNWKLVFKTGEIFWSDECYRICGFEPQEIAPTYQLFTDLVHEDDKERFLKAVGRAENRGEGYFIEFRIRRPDGSVRMTDNIAQVFENDAGVPVEMVGTIQDISERKHTEDALSESEARLAEAEQITNTGSWAVYFESDRQTRAYWSAQQCVIYGIGQDETPQGFQAFLQHVHEEDRQTVARLWAVALTNGTPLDADFRILRPGGEQRSVHVQSGPIAEESGGVRRVVGATTDVTERT